MKLPIKGKDVIALSPDGTKHFIFICACKNENCSEWRCSITGHGIMVDVVSWEYLE